jgi:hypothetical protein
LIEITPKKVEGLGWRPSVWLVYVFGVNLDNRYISILAMAMGVSSGLIA